MRRLDDQIGYCYAYDFLGLDAFASGNYPEAARFHEDAPRRATRLAPAYEEARARAHLGHALAA